MEFIEGFVLIASRQKTNNQTRLDLLYGPNTSSNPKILGRFNDNGLTPYNSLEEAALELDKLKFRLQSLKGMNFERVDIGFIRLTIADRKNCEEVNRIREERNLVLVEELRSDRDKFQEIYGPFTEDLDVVSNKPYWLFEENGLRSFTSLDRALYSMSELSRQAGILTRLAAISFIRLEGPQYFWPDLF